MALVLSRLRPAFGWRVSAALATLYLVWGSTYFATRLSLASLPPFRLGGVRYLVAGSALYAALRLRGAPSPSRRAWAASALTGALLLTLGNGLVAAAQRHVSSGLSAVVVATMPLFAALFGALMGTRPSPRDGAALFVGFSGVALLAARGGLAAGGALPLITLVCAPASFALGSVLGRRLPLPDGGMAAACQMLSGGALMLAVSAALGEAEAGPFTAASAGALAYLIIIGSLVGFSTYAFLLRTVRPSLATSYAYVNPVVALLLGASLGGEAISPAAWGACALVIGAVAILALGRR